MPPYGFDSAIIIGMPFSKQNDLKLSGYGRAAGRATPRKGPRRKVQETGHDTPESHKGRKLNMTLRTPKTTERLFAGTQ